MNFKVQFLHYTREFSTACAYIERFIKSKITRVYFFLLLLLNFAFVEKPSELQIH